MAKNRAGGNDRRSRGTCGPTLRRDRHMTWPDLQMAELSPWIRRPRHASATPRFFCPGAPVSRARSRSADAGCASCARVLRHGSGRRRAPVQRRRAASGRRDPEHLARSASRCGCGACSNATSRQRCASCSRRASAAASAWTSRCRRRSSSGVAEVFPLETRRSVVRLREERASRRVEHWQNLVIAACEQCGRNRVPAMHPVIGSGRLAGHAGRRPTEARADALPGGAARLARAARPVRSAAAGRARGRPRARRAGTLAQAAAFTPCGSGRASCARRPRRWRPWPRCMRCGAISSALRQPAGYAARCSWPLYCRVSQQP